MTSRSYDLRILTSRSYDPLIMTSRSYDPRIWTSRSYDFPEFWLHSCMISPKLDFLELWISQMHVILSSLQSPS